MKLSKLIPAPYREYVRLAVAALSLLTILSLGLYVKYLQAEVAEGKAAKVEVDATSRALKTYTKGTAKVSAERQEALHEVDDVRQGYPAWADEPLPSDAADLLREPTE